MTPTRWCLTLALCLAAACSVGAQPLPDLKTLRAMTPEARGDLLRAAAARRVAPAPGLDTEPPGLQILEVASQVDASAAGTHLPVLVKVIDDRSGLQLVAVEAAHPEAGFAMVDELGLLGGRLSVREHLALRPHPLSRPGIWQVMRVWALDMAGNLMLCELECVRGITGNRHSFRVTGRPQDSQPPTLLAGRIETPRLHLSQPAPGTMDVLPWARVTLTVTDAGGAGVQTAYATACTPEGLDCLVLQAADATGLGSDRRVMRLSGQVWPEMARGSYRLRTLLLRDQAGNQTELLSSDFGGDTDFAAWFGNQRTIEIRR